MNLQAPGVELQGDVKALEQVTVSPDGTRAVTIAEERIDVWNAITGKHFFKLEATPELCRYPVVPAWPLV